ncbi:MAG: hypothetical protein GYB65_18205 [Chloroflexi bacterium]|nr:hypothetical protein [Chloroflexota bacterium]
MSKRQIVVLALVFVFALSVMAFAVMPGQDAPAADEGNSVARFMADDGVDFDNPNCPIPSEPGCDGG